MGTSRRVDPIRRSPTAMTRTRLLPLLLALALVAVACEPSAFTTPQTPTTPPVVDGDGGGGVPAPDEPASGCDGTPFPGDPAFAALVCEYQAALLGALADGIDVSSDLRSQVTDALVQWITDPGGARAILENAIAEIETVRASIPPLTGTVVDVADDLFSCIDTATDLLAEATNRVEIGGVPMPGLDGWRATFDQAAELAETGDIVGATQLLCDLNVEMDDWLFQS